MKNSRIYFPHKDEQHAVDPQKMDEPQDATSGGEHDQEDDRPGNSRRRKIRECASERQVHVPLDELERDEADRRWHQELPRPVLYEFSV